MKIIEMPIILNGAEEHLAPAAFAKSFNTEITYDKTLLRYRSRSSIGTAMEGAVIDIQNSDPGKLFINVDNIGDYFSAKDTLLKLYFDTYLGESISTPVSFVESQTRLSDDNCLNAINLTGKIVSGRFTLDSICGLEYKAVPRNSSKIAVESLHPNPAENSVVVSCNIPFKIRSKIKIINSFGIVAAELFDEELPAGKYDLSFNLGEFPSGAYSVVFEAGLYLQRIPLMIQK